MELVKFGEKWVAPIAFGGEYALVFIAYVATFVMAFWLFKMAGRDEMGKRILMTGIIGSVGAALVLIFVVGIPLSLFSELVWPVAEDTMTSLHHLGAAVGWGWWAHLAWTENYSW